MKRMLVSSVGTLSFTLTIAGCMSGLDSREIRSYSANYTLSLWKVERPEEASQRYGSQKVDTLGSNSKYKYQYQDDLIKILWSDDSYPFNFSLENKTDHSIQVPWEKAAYFDENGHGHRVIHTVRVLEMQNPQAPSIVLRKETIEDFVAAHDSTDLDPWPWPDGAGVRTASTWSRGSFLLNYIDLLNNSDTCSHFSGTYPTFRDFDTHIKSKIGKTYQVLLPLQIEDVTNDYIFTFRVESVSTRIDSSSSMRGNHFRR